MARYSVLRPLSLTERIAVAVAAVRAFSPLGSHEVYAALGEDTTPNRDIPLSVLKFIQYLETTGQFPDARRHLQRIIELIFALERAHILTKYGGNHVTSAYFTMIQLTDRQKQGVFWLAPALGGHFLHAIYASVVVKIFGTTKDGDQRAGTGVIISDDTVLTCAHVVNDMTAKIVKTADNTEFAVETEMAHDKVDIGCVKVARGSLTPARGLAFVTPSISEEVYTIGYPRVPLATSRPLIIQRGEIVSESISTVFSENVFLYSAISRPGNSGGPIVSRNGYIVGIVSQNLFEDSEPTPPFHAGIPSDVVNLALMEIGVQVELPIETFA